MAMAGGHSNAHQSLRTRIHHAMEGGHPAGTREALLESSLVALIVFNVIAAALETVPSLEAVYGRYFIAFEIFSIFVFTLEYLLRLWTVPEDPRFRGAGRISGRLRYARQPLMIVDLLAIAPAYIGLFFPIADHRFLRIFRLIRLMKVARYSPALATLWHVIVSERRALIGTLIILLGVTTVLAQMMYLVEGSIQPRLFGTLPDSMWWAITTLTTVGYGDAVPITALGKIIAGVTMILGVGLIALPVGIVATGFVQEIHRRDFVVTWSMLSSVPLFEDFDHTTLGEIMNSLRSRVVAADAGVTSAGQPAEAMYFVVSGQLEEEFGGSSESRSLGPGNYFGESALYYGRPYRASVTARSHARLLELSAEDFNSLLKRHPRLKERVEEIAVSVADDA
jgi:voltage-gated potassium channel